MQNYRNVYEQLRKETTELWSTTGFVDEGNVPSSIDAAEKILRNFVRKVEHEKSEREELIGAVEALQLQIDSDKFFDADAEKFLKGTSLATKELEYLSGNLTQLVGEYMHFEKLEKEGTKISSSSSGATAEQRSTSNTNLRAMKQLIETQLDETLRRIMDESREVEAKLRVKEVTLEQLKEDLEQERKKFQVAKIKVGGGRK